MTKCDECGEHSYKIRTMDEDGQPRDVCEDCYDIIKKEMIKRVNK